MNRFSIRCVRLEYGVECKSVKIGSKFAALIALLVLVGMPAMACFVPRQLLNTEEHACCRSMGDQCGSKKMPSPQSCCKSVSQEQQVYVSSAADLQISSPHLVLAVLPSAPDTVPAVQHFPSISVSDHSPPLSPPETTSILRI